MCDRRTFLLFLFGVAIALVTPIPARAADIRFEKLFFIQRSKNANEVHYDARVTRTGTLDPKNPVVGYWVNKAEDGSVSPISLLQKIAYGYSCDLTGDGKSWRFQLEAFKGRPMWVVKTDSGRWRVRTTIAGKNAYMTRLFVATDESGLVPKVLYVDVFGEQMSSRAAVQERVVHR
jgi:hypothetical protein